MGLLTQRGASNPTYSLAEWVAFQHTYGLKGGMATSYDTGQAQQLMKAAVTIAGSEAKLGKAAGFSQNAIWHAKRYGRVSAEMAAAIHRATGGAISKERLRPDLYDTAVDAQAA